MTENKGSKALSYALFAVVALIWGLSFLVIKNALDELNTYEVLAIRWAMSAICFLILILTGFFKVNYKGKNLKGILGVVLSQPCLYSILECTGIDKTTASESSIMVAAVPIMVILESRILFGTKVGKKAIIGVIVGFMGVTCCLIFGPNVTGGSELWGYLSLLAAITVGGLYCIGTSKISSEFSIVEISTAMAVGGGIFFTILSLIMGNGVHPYQVFFQGGSTMWCLIFLGVGCGTVAYAISNYNIVKINPTVASCIQTNAINIVGVVAGIIFGGDSWGIYTVIGMILMCIGIIICALAPQNK